MIFISRKGENTMKKLFKFFIRICAAIVFIACLAAAYAFYIEPQILIVKEHKIGSNVQGEEVKVVQFSDLHVGEHYSRDQLNRLVKKINSRDPDILVFTGDLYDNYSVYNDNSMVVEELSAMKARLGKFAIWGNRDYGGGAHRQYAQIMQDAGFRLLKNNAKHIKLSNGSILSIGGLDDTLLGNPDEAAALSAMEGGNFKLLLMHEPDRADNFGGSGANLILAGHSHGGQIRLPFVNVVTTSLARKYVSGFYDIESDAGLRLFVNTGIGTTRIHARLLVPPRIDVFRIKL